MRAKRSKGRKNPVLTSPWKIGLFVALMLLVTGFGVGYYIIRMYGIDPVWMRSGTGRWIVDSYEFFREMYPPAAGVVVISLCSYFVIASAVRRYRRFLDSGQDYRRMVSLAGSIDDLTNPAQIARLSRFPELQNVLRSYGDQIREISEQIDEKQLDTAPANLNLEIDSVLKGNPVGETSEEEAWWKPMLRKVEAALRERSAASEETERRCDETRQAASRAALACGRLMESLAGAGEDIVEIVAAAGRLAASARDRGAASGRATAATGGAGAAEIETIMHAVRGLETSGREMGGLSEESNGHALSIALMAARGNVNEHDLAQCAERVRMTAEQIGKLGRRVQELSESLRDGCQAVTAPALGARAAATASEKDDIDPIAVLAALVKRRGGALQDKLNVLGNDVEEISSALRSVCPAECSAEETSGWTPTPEDAGPLRGDEEVHYDDTPCDTGEGRETVLQRDPEPGAERWERNEEEARVGTEAPLDGSVSLREGTARAGDEGTIVNFGAGSEESADAVDNDMVIDRPGMTDDSGARSGTFWEADTGMSDAPAKHARRDPAGETLEASPPVQDRAAPSVSPSPGPAANIEASAAEVEAPSVPPSAAPAAAVEAPAEAEQARSDDDWMGMPGHRWVDARARGSADAAEVCPDRRVEETGGPMPETDEAGTDTAGTAARSEAGAEIRARRDAAVTTDSDSEPIYDLFELGAVECLEESENVL